ncbi:MAG: single-stranded DNA-binding protein [Pseudomonadota bacterium]
MSGSINKVILVGRLGADPEIRSMNSGDRIANLRLATSETWRDKSSGERKEKTEWHRISVFNDHLVKVVEQYLKKGSHVYLEGSLQTRKWTDQAGVEKFSTEVVLQKFRGELTMLDGPSGGDTSSAERSTGSSGFGSGTGGGGSGPREDFSADLDSEIPFVSAYGLR